EGDPVDLLVAVDDLPVGGEGDGGVAEVLVAGVLHDAGDQRGVDAPGEVDQLVVLAGGLERRDVDDVLGPDDEVDAGVDVLAGDQVALEDLALVGVPGPGALGSAALDQRDAQLADRLRPGQGHGQPGHRHDQGAGDRGRPPPAGQRRGEGDGGDDGDLDEQQRAAQAQDRGER